MEGWIKIHRGILDWEWYQDVNVRILFIHCLLLANWKETRYKGEIVPRGSFVASLPILSKETGLSIRQARTALDKLKMTGELTVKKYPKYTVFTISNYCVYQDGDRQDDSQMTGNRQANGQSNDRQVTGSIYTKVNNLLNKEEDKNLRNKENNNIYSSEPETVSEPPIITLQLNDGTEHPVTQSDIDNYASLYPAVDIMQALRNMRGWCEANPTKRKTKRGIAKFIHSWLSKEQDKGGSRTYAPQPKRYDPVEEWFRQKEAENAGNGISADSKSTEGISGLLP